MKVFNLLIVSLFLAFTGCDRTSGTTELKLAHSLDINHPVHKAMVRMAELVAEKSAGQMGIDIYPSQQLGTERQCLELLQIGSLAMTKVSASVMENFAPSNKVFSLPYIFRSDEHAYAVLDGEIGRELLLQGQDYWLRGLCYFDAGSRSFYTKEKPVATPADLKGLKIRVQESQTSMDMVKALGGSPTPISWGELYTALQQGVVDGAENNPPSFYLSRHYEVCKYYSINEHTSVPDILVISTIVWKRLSSQEQQWLQEAADGAARYQRVLWAESEKEALEAVAAAGVEISYPEKEQFSELCNTVYEQYRKDPAVADIIDRIKAVPDE